jgi:hypothetical protein
MNDRQHDSPGLDASQEAMLMARSILLLLKEGQYESPLILGNKVEGLLQKIAVGDATVFTELTSPEMQAELQRAELAQKEEVEDNEKTAREWANHDDGWIPAVNALRAEEGRTIVRWLISLGRSDGALATVRADVEQVLHGKGEKWARRFAELRATMKG